MATVAKVVCLLVAFMVAAAPAAAEAAIKCDDVTIKLVPCVSYLEGGPGPTSTCCSGVRALNAMARTPQDRLVVCLCLTRSIASIPGLNVASAAALPDECGVSIPYPIGPNTDCFRLH